MCPRRSCTKSTASNSENWFTWDQDHPSLDETVTAACATYQAFQRYLSGRDLYLVPRSFNDLEGVLYVLRSSAAARHLLMS